MENCPVNKNFTKIPRFGREGNPYWRCILLFQCNFSTQERVDPFGRDIAARTTAVGTGQGEALAGRAYPRSSSIAAISCRGQRQGAM